MENTWIKYGDKTIRWTHKDNQNFLKIQILNPIFKKNFLKLEQMKSNFKKIIDTTGRKTNIEEHAIHLICLEEIKKNLQLVCVDKHNDEHNNEHIIPWVGIKTENIKNRRRELDTNGFYNFPLF